jgi:hypothetical protein
MLPPHLRDPNRMPRRGRGTGRLVLVKVKAESAKRHLRMLGSSADQFEITNAVCKLNEIIDLCEEEETK